MTSNSPTSLAMALLRGGMMIIPQSDADPAWRKSLATVMSNMAYYGFTPSLRGLRALEGLSHASLKEFWADLEPALAELTGANRQMSDAIVYKNFPTETLDMDQAEYWLNQISMYLGASADHVREGKKTRTSVIEELKLKVLEPAGLDAASNRLESLIARTASWTAAEHQDALALFEACPPAKIIFGAFPVRTNAAILAAAALKATTAPKIEFGTPVDVLRTIAVLAGSDPRLNTAFRVPSMPRARRRLLVEALEAWDTQTLAESFAHHRGVWKQALMRLHPGDYPAPRLQAAYDLLYRGNARPFEEQLTRAIAARHPGTLALASTRPGVFARRLRQLHSAFGQAAFQAFLPHLEGLTTLQILRLERIFSTLNSRRTRLYAPKGRLARAHAVPAPQATIPGEDISFLCEALGAELKYRLQRDIASGVDLGPDMERVRIAMNGQELAPHGRGTRLPLPAEVTFVRSMSWWKFENTQKTGWFDNGWNFFGADWKPLGVTCWDQERLPAEEEGAGDAAIFSGDPVSGETGGVGAQAIDLYLDKLSSQGVRYAAWSVLCYSDIPFNGDAEVFACLQWGADATSGEIFEPARAQMAFPLTSGEKSNVVALLDLETRELIYLDAPLPISVNSARSNSGQLQKILPALLEVVETQPSLHDLFSHAAPGSLPVRYSDRDAPVCGPAVVFDQENPASEIEPFQVDKVLAQRGMRDQAAIRAA